MAAIIRDACGLEPELIVGHDKIFEVAVNGERVYTNGRECGVFPDPDEIVRLVRSRQNA